MTKFFGLGIASALSVALLSACGGGGGSDTPPPAPLQQPIAVTSFELLSGYKALIAAGRTNNFTVSGTCSGLATITTSIPSAATFEGASALAAASTSTLNLTNALLLQVRPHLPDISIATTTLLDILRLALNMAYF